MEAILLRPALKEIIWGGSKLKNDFGYQTNLTHIAEAWVVSAHKDGVSTAVGGSYNGMGLDKIVTQNPDFVGSSFSGAFPLMVKFIDAAKDLSIQVHPDDTYAMAHEGGYGKTEMWYIMSAEPGAFIYYGMKRQVSPEEFAESIQNGTVCSLLNKVECKVGDVFFIPAKTVHAIGAGLLICEIQQSANLTYRIFDYNRPGADGKPRELHVAKATAVTDLRAVVPNSKPCGTMKLENGLSKTVLVACECFTTTLCECDFQGTDSDVGFALLSILEGEAQLTTSDNTITVKKGDGVFLPCNLGKYRINGKVTYIKATL